MIQKHKNAKPPSTLPTTSRSVSPNPAYWETTPHGAQKIAPSGTNTKIQNHRPETATRPNSSILRQGDDRFETTTECFSLIYSRPSNQRGNPIALALVNTQWNRWYQPKPNSWPKQSAVISWGKNEEKLVPKIDLHTFASSRNYKKELRKIMRSLPPSTPGLDKKAKIIFARKQDANQLQHLTRWRLKKADKFENVTEKSPTIISSTVQTSAQRKPGYSRQKKSAPRLLISFIIGPFRRYLSKSFSNSSKLTEN